MEGKQVRRVLFLLFFLTLFLMVGRLFSPFLTVILWSGLIYAFLAPLHGLLALKSNGKERGEPWKSLLAGGFAVGGVLILVLPVAFLGIAMFGQIGDLAQAVNQVVEAHPEFLDLSPDGPVGGFIYRVTGGAIDLSTVDLRGELSRWIHGSTASIIGFSGRILKNATQLVVALAFMIFTLYFLFADGRHLVRVLIGSMPIERDYTTLFLRKLRDTSRQLVQGYILVALIQATAAFILFSLFRVKGPLVLSALTGIASFIPMLGTSLVWFPISLLRILSGEFASGLALMILSMFFISTLDNFIRPILLHDKLKIHPLLIFFSIVGGLQVFGFNGLILGPLVLILFFTGVGLYDKVYEREEEPGAEREEGEGKADGTSQPGE